MRYVVVRQGITGWFVVGEVVSDEQPAWADELAEEFKDWLGPETGRDWYSNPKSYAQGFAESNDEVLTLDEATERYPEAIRAWRAGDDRVHEEYREKDADGLVDALHDMEMLARNGDAEAKRLVLDPATTIKDIRRHLWRDAIEKAEGRGVVNA
jgi:hypothetical protein